MPAYLPPHRRQVVPSNTRDRDEQDPPPAILSLRWQGERPSSSGHRKASTYGALLQAHGDSFVGPLTQLSRKLVDVHRYSGATAKGLGNEKSSQQAGQKLIACLDRTRPDKVLLQFGNVDINISSVYKLETQGSVDWDEKQFIAETWNSYQAFVEAHILTRLVLTCPPSSLPPESSSFEKPAYIRDVYFCTATLPVVCDDALPESHAKYQYTGSKKDKRGSSSEETKDLESQSARRIQRVKPLMQLCGLEARRRMTADFNARLKDFVEESVDGFSHQGPARLHLVDLNQYIRKHPDSEEVASQYVTCDPTNLHITWENTLPFWILELASTGLHTSHMPTARELEEQSASYVARKSEQMETMKEKRRNV